MVVGPKTRRYLESKRNPGGSAWAFMQEMQKTAEEIAERVVAETIKNDKEEIAGELQDAKGKALKQLGQMFELFMAEFKKAVKQKLDSMPQLKGDPGKTPKKGVDYFDGKPGENGKTPVADKDYPSTKSVERMVLAAAKALYGKLKEEGLTKKQLLAAVDDGLKNIEGKAVARALEKLRGIDRLDYEALKNRPGTPVTDTRSQRTVHRGGGGKETYEYDLSDLCDGNTKVFTIPSNTRIVLVQSTDAPAGILRKTTDWTGSGTTTLTLTGAVAAPTAGATLSILYVV